MPDQNTGKELMDSAVISITGVGMSHEFIKNQQIRLVVIEIVWCFTGTRESVFVIFVKGSAISRHVNLFFQYKNPVELSPVTLRATKLNHYAVSIISECVYEISIDVAICDNL